MLSREDKNLILCWLDEGVYRLVAPGEKPNIDRFCQEAALLPRGNCKELQHFPQKTINECIRHHVKNGAWKCCPTPTRTNYEILLNWGREMQALESKNLAPAPIAKPAPAPSSGPSNTPSSSASPPPPPPLSTGPQSAYASGETAYPTPGDTPTGPESPKKETVQNWWNIPPSTHEDAPTRTTRQRFEDLILNAESLFLDRRSQSSAEDDLAFAPLFTSDIAGKIAESAIPPQCAIFGKFLGPESTDSSERRLLLLNTNTPWTTFICGLQGAGKSHSLTVMLESSFISHKSICILEKPLAGVVFHYSPYNSNVGNKPCEAAYLANLRDNSGSPSPPEVTVLVSRSNLGNMRAAYADIENITVKEFLLNPRQLTLDTMFNLMSVQENNGILYVEIVRRVLRDMAIENDASGVLFDYDEFKERLFKEKLDNMQLRPLNQRLAILESFIGPKDSPNLFHATPGTLTIVDLTCPFVDAETACVLFSICNQLFISAPRQSGKIIALDEAHRYMADNASASVQRFAKSIIGNIRLQRHLGLRTIISTQDPFIHPELLELSSMVIFHRFTSPRWFETIRKHVGFQAKAQPADSSRVWGEDEPQKGEEDIFNNIMSLDPGEAYIYCPLLVTPENNWGGSTLKKFGNGVFKVMIRQKITVDGGASRNVL